MITCAATLFPLRGDLGAGVSWVSCPREGTAQQNAENKTVRFLAFQSTKQSWKDRSKSRFSCPPRKQTTPKSLAWERRGRQEGREENLGRPGAPSSAEG